MLQNSNEPREALTPGVREDQQAGGSGPARTVPQASDNPHPRLSIEDFRARRAFERDRRELALDIVRAHLGEQPSPRAIRSCSRRWADDIRNLAEAVIKARQEAA